MPFNSRGPVIMLYCVDVIRLLKQKSTSEYDFNTSTYFITRWLILTVLSQQW